MERTYVGLVHKDPDSDYGGSFPDLPGCTTAGSAIEEACKSARPALACHLENMADDGASIPEPRSASDVLAHSDAADAIALIVVEALSGRKDEKKRLATIGVGLTTI